MKDLLEAFRALRSSPRAFWLILFAFSVDMAAYFGILPLMKAYLGHDVGIAPAWASTWVSMFTGALTLVMLFLGKPAEEKLGVRNGLLAALLLVVLGRALYSSVPFVGGLTLLVSALLLIAVGEGVVTPLVYAGIKKYTNVQTGPMGYALLYAFMNLAAALMGPLSAKVRTSFDTRHHAGTSALSGFNAVNWVCVAITLVAALSVAFFFTKRVEANVVRVALEAETDSSNAAGAESTSSAKSRSPFRDARFLFFIFALFPVRTLFAHQWLTMPEYVLRAYPANVADKMEWLVDSVNPIIIFFGVPLMTAFTKRFHVLTMMIVGSAVSAGSTFLLSGGPHTSTLILYFVVFSIGEALWSSRFIEYAAELAPEGRVAQYMGLASMPWFLAKTTTGLYSGAMLERFCPKTGPQNAGTMWLLYGLLAAASPVALWLGRRWVRAGMTEKTAVSAPPLEAATAG